nr:P4 [Taro bacilliform virus]
MLLNICTAKEFKPSKDKLILDLLATAGFCKHQHLLGLSYLRTWRPPLYLMVTFHSGFLITIKLLLTVLLRIIHILILMKMKTNLLVFFLMGKMSWSTLLSLQFKKNQFLLSLMEKKSQMRKYRKTLSFPSETLLL